MKVEQRDQKRAKHFSNFFSVSNPLTLVFDRLSELNPYTFYHYYRCINVVCLVLHYKCKNAVNILFLFVQTVLT